MDVVSDGVVLYGHFEDWISIGNMTFTNSSTQNLGRMMPDLKFRFEIEFDLNESGDGSCVQSLKQDRMVKTINKDENSDGIKLALQDVQIHNIPLECYPDMISSRTRFCLTAVFILMPILIHFSQSSLESVRSNFHKYKCIKQQILKMDGLF